MKNKSFKNGSYPNDKCEFHKKKNPSVSIKQNYQQQNFLRVTTEETHYEKKKHILIIFTTNYDFKV